MRVLRIGSAVQPDRLLGACGRVVILGGVLLVRPSLGSNLVFVFAPILFMLVPGLVLRARRRPSPRLHAVS